MRSRGERIPLTPVSKTLNRASAVADLKTPRHEKDSIMVQLASCRGGPRIHGTTVEACVRYGESITFLAHLLFTWKCQRFPSRDGALEASDTRASQGASPSSTEPHSSWRCASASRSKWCAASQWRPTAANGVVVIPPDRPTASQLDPAFPGSPPVRSSGTMPPASGMVGLFG